MNMSLMRAMLLSSLNKAEMYVSAHPGLFLSDSKRDYKLIAGHSPCEKGDTFTLQIFCLTIAEHKEPVVAEKPHKTIQLESLEAFTEYLGKFDFDPHNGWIPVD